MKKIYSKPEIVFENFTLNTNIAGNCNTIIGNQSESSCAYIDRSGNRVFTNALSAICVDVQQADGANNGICYHVPIETNDLFNS